MFASFNVRAVGLAPIDAGRTIELAATAGFAGVDLMVRDLVRDGSDPERLRASMDGRGLRGGAFPLPVNWRGDEATFRRDLAELPRLADAAATLGLTRTATWVMPELPEADSDRDEVAALHVRRLGAIARVLGDRGIRLGLEAIGVESFRTGRGGRFVASLADLDRELPTIRAEPGIGLLIDAFHLYAAGEPIGAALAHGVGAIVWLHIADLPPGADGDRSRIIDAERGLPGENGKVPAGELLRSLAAEGYDGPVTAEPLARCGSLRGLGAETVARRVKESLDRIWPGASSDTRGPIRDARC